MPTDTMRPESESLNFDGPSGPIEALLDTPPNFDGARTAVVCHPHPLFGGTMDNKVVHTLARALNELGIAALRFNFRGVGGSAGAFDEGNGETDDCIAATQWLKTRFPDSNLWLAGFSFGGFVALRASDTLSPAQLITVAPAVRWFDGADAVQPDCPWLLLQGEADDVVEADGVYSWLDERQLSPSIRRFPGIGHFFHGSLTELKQAIIDELGTSG